MFKKAVPVFAAGYENEMNILLGFFVNVPKCENAVLRITGITQYKVFVGGAFVHHGPARTCHNKYRVDEIDISKYLVSENTPVVIRLLSSNCNGYSAVEEPGFLCAEVESDGEIIAFTGINGSFSCVLLDEHIQKTLRYSFQRTFSEAYVLSPDKEIFNSKPTESSYKSIELVEFEPKNYIPRDLYYPDFTFEESKRIIKKGSFVSGEPYEFVPSREHIPTDIFHCFPVEDIAVNIKAEFHSNKCSVAEEGDFSSADFFVGEESFVLADMGKELTGFVEISVEAVENSEIFIAFDEVLNGETVNPDRLGVINILKFTLEKGKYLLQTAEPYTFRFMQICVSKGNIKVAKAGLRRVGFYEITEKLNSENEAELKIYDAAVETFRQNTYDIFMDCPSRERAGWLCDSFFTGRSEYAFTGKNEVERAFLMNFIMEDGDFPYLPHGMLPMCFPSEHNDTIFIPNWAMFFVVELEDYFKRSGDTELVAAAKEKVLALCEYFIKFENSDGLLEKLEKWIMIEWSRAQEFKYDVNFPTNALYAGMLDAASRLYGMPELSKKADRIREYIRKNAVINGFFCDNMVRNEQGDLVLSGHCTEVCQYYMFFFGVATPELHPDLWKIISEEFGPDRVKQGKYPNIYPANAFIGNYLRLDILFQNKLYDKVMEEINGYFLYMAEKTGTLWEMISDGASCNHGFASYVAVLMLKIRNKK